jgi:hypothetical protein
MLSEDGSVEAGTAWHVSLSQSISIHSSISSTVGRKIDGGFLFFFFFSEALYSPAAHLSGIRRARLATGCGTVGRATRRPTSSTTPNSPPLKATRSSASRGTSTTLCLSLSLELLSPIRYSPITIGSALRRRAWQASASIIKAVVGAGSFALPWAFLQAGLFGAPLSPSVCPQGAGG